MTTIFFLKSFDMLSLSLSQTFFFFKFNFFIVLRSSFCFLLLFLPIFSSSSTPPHVSPRANMSMMIACIGRANLMMMLLLLLMHSRVGLNVPFHQIQVFCARFSRFLALVDLRFYRSSFPSIESGIMMRRSFVKLKPPL